jgi:hypothetical protein
MNLNKIAALLAAFGLTVGFALPAAALSLGVGTGANVQVSVDGSASANASTSDNVAVSATNSTDVNATSSTNLTPVFVTQADVSAGMVTPTSDNPASVQSSSDLSGYVAARLQDDSNISQIQASGSNVAVTYTEPAKVLGIFPVNVEATATVNNDGVVAISYPWYAFIFSTNTSDLQDKIQTSVSADLGANASAGFSAAQQAKLISDISSVMQGEASASVTQ